MIQTFLGRVVGLLALALLVIGCDGEDAGPAQADTKQQQVAASEAVQEAAEQQAQSTAVEGPASEVGRSDEVERGQSEKDGHQPSANVGEQSVSGTLRGEDGALVITEALDCESAGSVVEGELAAARKPNEQSDEHRADEAAELEDEEQGEKLVLVEAVNEAMDAWISQLETLTLEASMAGGVSNRCVELAVNVAIQLDPLTAWAVGDFSGLFEIHTGLSLAESERPILMQQYSLEEQAYSTVTGMDGWTGPLWHWPHDYEGMIHQYFGIRPSFFTHLGRHRDELECATYDGGTIAEDRYEGGAVWVVTCATDVDSVMPFLGGYFNDDYDLTMAQVTISQSSGAPLLTEYRRVSRNSDGELSWSSVKVALTSWNEQIDFPTPEPFVEYAEYEDLIERLKASAARPEQVIDLAQRWLDGQDRIESTVELRLEIDGGEHESHSTMRESRSLGALERTWMVEEQLSANSTTWKPGRRLFWNRDGFWVSDADVDGEPVWTASTPAANGFGDMTVDELLAERAWIDLALFRGLLDLSETIVVTPGDGWMEYDVQIQIGVLEAGDTHFDRVAALIKSALSELEYGDLSVRRIDSFVIDVWLNHSGRVGPLAQITETEFLSDAGTIKLWTLWAVGNLYELIQQPFTFPSP